MSSKNSVYISYSWNVEDKNGTVEKLLAVFADQGIEVKRDVQEIGYGDPIKKYMDELAAGGAIILVLSEPYFKSPNCMYELREIYLNNRKDFRQRIFPVVLQGTRFHRAIDRIPYISFWEEETKKLEAALASVARENIGTVSHQELRDHADFRRMIDDLLSIIGDINHWREEDHLQDNFFSLFKSIISESVVQEDKDRDQDRQDKDTGDTSYTQSGQYREYSGSEQSVDVGQQVDGNGNAISGSGDVTVNNIMHHHYSPETSSQKRPTPSESKIFFGVPELPPNYLPRKEYIEEFRTALQKESIGLTGAAHVGVPGMGGLGKSVLAVALARDEDVQAAFPDGIFWLTFGQNVENDDLLARQNQILELLGHQKKETSLDLTRHQLNTILHGKRCLFIIDDIWDSRHLKSFDLSGTDCRFMLTSRKTDVLERLGIDGKPIELLSEAQALAMLARYSAYTPDELPAEAAEIVKECGYLPLAVAAIGSMVKKKPANRWQLALRKLQEAKLDKISFKFEYQYENLFRALQVSVEALTATAQKYYATLAVFREDAKIPESVITMYWEHCRFSDDEPLDVIDALVDASLLTRTDDKFLSLHDLLRDYLISQIKDVAELHRQLFTAYKTAYPGGWHTISDSDSFYFQKNWMDHAEKAQVKVDLVKEIAANFIVV